MKKLGWSLSVIGLIVQLIARLAGRLLQFGLIEEPLIPRDLRLIMGWGGTLVLIAGLILIVRSKGRCWAWALLGIFSFVGMIVAAMLKMRDDLYPSEEDLEQVN